MNVGAKAMSNTGLVTTPDATVHIALAVPEAQRLLFLADEALEDYRANLPGDKDGLPTLESAMRKLRKALSEGES